MYPALENQMQSAREQSEKCQDENDMVIPRQPRKWIVSRKPARDGLRHSRIGDGAKLDKANHGRQEKREDTKGESHLLKCLQHLTKRGEKPRAGSVANTLNFSRNGAVGFIVWLDRIRPFLD